MIHVFLIHALNDFYLHNDTMFVGFWFWFEKAIAASYANIRLSNTKISKTKVRSFAVNNNPIANGLIFAAFRSAKMKGTGVHIYNAIRANFDNVSFESNSNFEVRIKDLNVIVAANPNNNFCTYTVCRTSYDFNSIRSNFKYQFHKELCWFCK